MIRRYNISPPTDIQKDVCARFAKESVDTSAGYYSSHRNQHDVSKVIRDIYIGKCAEFSVYNFFNTSGVYEVSEPDVNIYDTYSKSFDCDIYMEDKHVHVKSYYPSSIEVSWVFDPKDSLISNPSKLDVLALCDLNTDGSGVLYLMKGLLAIPFYRDPMLARLKGKKKCIYLNDIKNL